MSVTKEERLYDVMIDEFKLICKVVEDKGYIIQYKTQMINALKNANPTNASSTDKLEERN